MSQRDGGPAFPSASYWDVREEDYRPVETDGGMSLRDYFAGQVVGHVVAGLLADKASHRQLRRNPEDIAEAPAALAYEIADAMLRAREEA